MGWFGVLVCFLGLCFSELATGNVILTPPATTLYSPTVGIVVLHEVDIPADAYIMVMEEVVSQLAVYSIGGWVNIPDFDKNLTDDETAELLSQSQQELLASGMPASSTLILIGHGWGGFSSQDYLYSVGGNVTESWSTGVTGHILFGSYIQRTYYQNEGVFPTSTMTIGGELDGVFRVTRTMEAQYRYTSSPSEVISYNDMVSLLVGLNHMGYLNISSSAIPSFYKENDLKSELADSDGYKEISMTVASYIAYLFGSNDLDVQNDLANSAKNTASFFAPLIAAFEQEGYYFFQPPCDGPYSNKPATKAGNCVKSSPTTPSGQISVCGLPEVNFNINDGFHDVSEFFPVDYIPSIANSCQSQTDCTLNITTVSENFYYEDNVSNPVSAYETAGKLKSRQACWAASGVHKPNFKELDGPSLCGEFNAVTYQSTSSSLPDTTLKRFQMYGFDMVMGNDTVIAAFPSWSSTPMSYEVEKNGAGEEILLVSAVALVTSTINPASPGYHFCSLLSPARVVEWIYVDSLRYHYSLGSI